MKMLLALVLMLCLTNTYSENLGQKAPTYALDQDAREQIKAVISKKIRSGEVAQYQKNQITVLKHKLHDFGNLGLATDNRYKTEFRDLAFTIPKDFKDANGTISVKRGTVIRPLEKVKLQSGLIFIDGNDPKQISYAIHRSQTESLKIVLTNGSPYELRVRYKNAPWRGGKAIPFYFDQEGVIIKTLHLNYAVDIKTVPTIISQQGTKLLVETGVRI